MRRALALALALAACDDAPLRAGDWHPDGGATARDARVADALVADAATVADARVRDAAPLDAADAAPPDCTAELAEGRAQLEGGEPRLALHAYEAALARCPGDRRATFGAALSGALDSVELTYMLFSVVGQIGGLAGKSRNDALAESLHLEFMSLRAELQQSLDRAATLAPEDVDFEVDGAWLYLGVEPSVAYRGVFDGGDLHLFRASVSMVLGVLDIVAAQDLSGPLFDLVHALTGGGASLDFTTIQTLLGGLLKAERGRFLTLHPTDGAAVFAESRGHFSAVGRELVAAVDWMRAEHDPRPQISRVEPLPDGGARLIVQGLAHREDDGTITERPFVTTLGAPVLAALAHASAAFDRPGDLVPFRTEALPILATVLHAAAQFGALDAFTDALPIHLDGLSRDAVQALLGTLLPLPVALDFGTYYQHPTGLRPMMPRVAEGDAPRFLAEWECPADLDDQGLPSAARGILCGDAAMVTDAPHFAGTPYAIEPDGLTPRMPYFAWDDPTWNGLLQVDLSGLGVPGWDAPGWRRPDLRDLDAALAVGLEPFLRILAGALH
jgi:hypothetical protein